MQKKSSAKPSNSFRNKVLNIVARIPRGKTSSYGEVALGAGNEKAARAVGAIMAANRDPDVPCHRVTGKSGAMVGYSGVGGIRAKQRRLKKEGAINNSPH